MRAQYPPPEMGKPSDRGGREGFDKAAESYGQHYNAARCSQQAPSAAHLGYLQIALKLGCISVACAENSSQREFARFLRSWQ